MLLDNAAVYPAPEDSASHQFGRALHWSPDSRRVALVDCIGGADAKRQCSIVVVGAALAAQQFPVTDGNADVNFYWQKSRALAIEQGAVPNTVTVQ